MAIRHEEVDVVPADLNELDHHVARRQRVQRREVEEGRRHRQPPLVEEEHEVVPREHDGPPSKVGVDEWRLVPRFTHRKHA